jgi:hypothetical protein
MPRRQQAAPVVEVVVALLLFGAARRERDAGALGQDAQGFGEVDAVALHDELKSVAALVALAEAAPVAALGPHRKGGRVVLMRMEGAQPGEGAARLPQLDGLGDQFDQIEPALDVVNDAHAARTKLG